MKYLLLLFTFMLIACEDSKEVATTSDSSSPYQRCEQNLEVIGRWHNENMDLEIGNDCYGKMETIQNNSLCISDFYYWKPVGGVLRIKIEKSDCHVLEEVKLVINHQLEPSEYLTVTWQSGTTTYFTPVEE